MQHTTNDDPQEPAGPEPEHDGVRRLPHYVSGVAGSLTMLLGWVIHAPTEIMVPLVGSVGGLSGAITSALSQRSRAKKRAAQMKRRQSAQRRRDNAAKAASTPNASAPKPKAVSATKANDTKAKAGKAIAPKRTRSKKPDSNR